MSLILLINPKQYGSSSSTIGYDGSDPWVKKYLDNYRKRLKEKEVLEEIEVQAPPVIEEKVPSPIEETPSVIQREIVNYDGILQKLDNLQALLLKAVDSEAKAALLLQQQALLKERALIAKRILQAEDEELATYFYLLD